MKGKLFIFVIITILTAFRYSGKKAYDEIPGKSYHPVVLGQKYEYVADLTKYSIYFDSSVTEIQGRKYIKQTVDYKSSQTFAYYREEGGNVLYIKPEQNHETIEIPVNPVVGATWYESDSTWKYTITETRETLETPQAIFLNCLVIQSENIDRRANPDHYRLYLQYYQRGRGYIGTKVGGLLNSYLTISE